MLLGFIAWVIGRNRGGFISAPELMETVRVFPTLQERISEEKVQTFLQRIAVSRIDFRRLAGYEMDFREFASQHLGRDLS